MFLDDNTRDKITIGIVIAIVILGITLYKIFDNTLFLAGAALFCFVTQLIINISNM